MTKGYVLGTVAKNKATRVRKANKIIKVLSKHKKISEARVLEIGTGAGYIAHEFSKVARRVDSVDIVDDRLIKKGYSQKIVVDELLPYKSAKFDVVITNHVLEHVPNQQKHLSEIRRVLKADGIVYLATPNKWWLTDPHYKLPFISWMPRSIAKLYLLATKRREWDIYSVSLKRLIYLAHQQGFSVENQAWNVLEKPEEYGMQPSILTRIAQLSPRVLKPLLLHLLPTHLVVLVGRIPNK